MKTMKTRRIGTLPALIAVRSMTPVPTYHCSSASFGAELFSQTLSSLVDHNALTR